METRIIDAEVLGNVPAWEVANSARLLSAEVLGDGTARAKVLPVADLSWYVNVWTCKADLVLVTANGEQYAGDLLALDADALQALTEQVIYEDHDSGINTSGQYYPLSQESRRMFDRLMATAKAKD